MWKRNGSIVCAVIFVCAADLVSAGESPSGCWFLREGHTVATAFPTGLQSVFLSEYFQIRYDASDPSFRDADRNGIPEILEKQKVVLDRSRHFLSTELGWRIPATGRYMNRPQLDIYFVPAPDDFVASTRTAPELHLLFNKNVLAARDFASLWIHQLAHAAELQYKQKGEYWFYEATAGWIEGQFDAHSRVANASRGAFLAHANIPLTDDTPLFALGASRFLDLLARPYRDVIRQIWEHWSYAEDETVLEIIQKVLALNHLPDLESYLQNYFLACSPLDTLSHNTTDVVVKPFSALVTQGLPEGASSGGVLLSFAPMKASTYSASLVYYDAEEKSGTLAMKKGLQGMWSILVPYQGLDHYKLVIVNNSSRELRGTLQKSFDSSIPAVLEYFHVNPGEGGVQLEWKTAKENGVAFWNLYKLRNGQKERLNSFPIPAAIHSEEGIHYLFVDSSDSAFYSLEAITSEGFESPASSVEKRR